MRLRVLFRLVVALAAVVLVAGCASSDDSGSGSTKDSPSTDAAATLTVSDAWVKAATAEDGMTAVFATLTNPTDEAITVTSATTDMSPTTELHEMAMQDGSMVMREIDGGIEVPADGSVSLEPGGLHVMVLDLPTDLVVGDEHEVTLTLDNGDTVTFKVVVKEFAGANESYDPNESGHSGGMHSGDMHSEGAGHSEGHGGAPTSG